MIDYSVQGYTKFQESYALESDRAVIILGASYINRYLEVYLKRFLVRHKVSDQLLSRHIGSFATRIDLAFALGLLGENARLQLQTLREMRNLCAHEDQSLNFESENIRRLCSRLTERIQQIDITEDPKSRFPNLGKKPAEFKSAREQFMFAVWFILLHLETQVERMKQTEISQLDFILDPHGQFDRAKKIVADAQEEVRKMRAAISQANGPSDASAEQPAADNRDGSGS